MTKNISPKTLGIAFAHALRENDPSQHALILKNFVAMLRSRFSIKKASKAAEEAERALVSMNGGRTIETHSAFPLEKNIKEQLRGILGKKDRIIERIDPSLIAGVKVVIDGEAAIDNTFRRKLQKLFPYSS